MGDPRKIRKTYQTPGHPWQKARIEEEKVIIKEYGMKNKKEIWKMESKLRDFADRAKKLIAASTGQAEKEREELLLKMKSIGLIPPEAGLDDILGLKLRNILERRLQTMLYKKNLARSMDQARQFIVHDHVMVGEKMINSPSYIVSVKEEGLIAFSSKSSLNNPEHPERVINSESNAKKEAKKKKLAEMAERKEKGQKWGQGRRKGKGNRERGRK